MLEMVVAHQLLVIDIVDNALLPQVFEEVEIWTTCSKSQTIPHVLSHMCHPPLPRLGAIELEKLCVAKKTLIRSRWSRTFKVVQAVCIPFFLLRGLEKAIEEPEAALEGRMWMLLFQHFNTIWDQ